MRKSFLPFVAVLALILPMGLAAQSVYFGAGPTFPIGDYGDYAKTGYVGIAGVSFDVGAENLSVFGEGFFGQNSHEFEGDKTYPYGAMGGLLYDLSPEGAGGVYFFGQVGFMIHKYDSNELGSESETGLGFGGGAGYGFPVGDTELFVEGRYMQGNFDGGNTAFIGLVGGVSIGFGN